MSVQQLSGRATEEQIREFVKDHFQRISNCTIDTVVNGWRVRHGRVLTAQELAWARAAYQQEDVARNARLAAERAAAEARKPRGPVNRFLAMGWKGQMLLGTIVFLVGLYAGCIAFYPLVAQNPLAGGIGATGSSQTSGTTSAARNNPQVALFENPGFQAATSILFWSVLVTGGVGGVLIFIIGWGIGYAIIQALRSLLRRPDPSPRT
jgi:hypothetical protein